MVFHRGSIFLLFVILDGDLFYINGSLEYARYDDARYDDAAAAYGCAFNLAIDF